MSSLKLRVAATDDIKSTTGVTTTRTSKAAWWIKNPPKKWTQKQQLQHTINERRQQRKQSFSQDMGDLFRNVALHGYNKLLDPELTLLEKLIWLSFHVTSMAALCVVLSFTWEQFVAQYFVINLHDPLYPVENIPFPAVSICSNNRISYQAAMEYAKELSFKDPRRREPNFFLGKIHDFTRLYYNYLPFEKRDEELSIEEDNKLFDFATFLEQFDTFDNETFWDTRKVMMRLTPKCKNFLIQCLLAGVEIDCFSEKAFQETLTTYGQCCTFNKKNSYTHRSSQNNFVSSDLGLTVLLNTSHIDDFHSILNIDGYAVIVHSPDDYPDISSGSSQEVLPTRSEESFVSIKARLIDTDESLRSYGPSGRKCLFDNEAPSPELLIKNSYSFTNCITLCRIRSIMALCDCVPFYMPLDLVDPSNGIVFCTLQHINCLLRYTFKWRNVITQRQNIPELKREREESLYCPSCLPSCDDVQYQISLMSLPLDRFRSSTNFRRIKRQGLNLENFSVLRVHFGEPHSLYYRRVIGNAWYEVISTVGNILSIFLGFSMLAVFEILYFLVKYFLIAGKKFILQNIRKDKNRNHKHKKNVKQLENTKLYIYP